MGRALACFFTNRLESLQPDTWKHSHAAPRQAVFTGPSRAGETAPATVFSVIQPTEGVVRHSLFIAASKCLILEPPRCSLASACHAHEPVEVTHIDQRILAHNPLIVTVLLSVQLDS